MIRELSRDHLHVIELVRRSPRMLSRFATARTWTPSLFADLVEEFVQRLADALEPSGLRHRQIRTGDVPGIRRELVLNEPVLDRSGCEFPAIPRDCRTPNPWKLGIFVTKSSI